MAEKILLILDDDPDVGQLIKYTSESLGIQTFFTSDPYKFFELLADMKPTHLALDLVMPHMDGVEVIRKLAHHGCTARMIITSGVGSRVLAAAKRSAVEHGLDIIGVLPKPFSPKTLRGLLAGDETEVAERQKSAKTPGFTTAELCEALDRDQLSVTFQPKISCLDGGLSGFEVLSRWMHKDHGPVPPDQFIPLAEGSDLINRLTYQMVEKGLAWFSRHFTGPGRHDVTLSMNLSARTLGDDQLIENLLNYCDRYRIPPSRLIFELTETSAMEDPMASLALLTRLRVKDFQLSIDDFGTGFSSMVQLVRLPFSEIKVDKSFVMTAMHSQESRTVVKSIVELGRSLGLKTTAEGVEDAKTLGYLKDIGCDYAQGYMISRPMAGDQAMNWVQERKVKAP